MTSKRRHERFVRRLETEFSADGKKYRGISSDLSCNGLFIRTNHAFAPGTVVDIVIHLPDGNSAKMKGKVKRAIKTPVVSLKNGMGVELIEKEHLFTQFMATFSADCGNNGSKASSSGPKPVEEAGSPAEFIIAVCPGCGVKNKVGRSRSHLNPKCGKCGTPLILTV